MPTQAFGAYSAELTAGTEVSSTYEGRHVSMLESELVHPSHTDGLVDKGDPVVFGTVALQGVGVSFKSAAAATDYVAIDTEGIWNLSVVAENDSGDCIVYGGDALYINIATAVISKIRNSDTHVPFGYALGQVAEGATAVIAVKVHWAPPVGITLQKEVEVTSAELLDLFATPKTLVAAPGAGKILQFDSIMVAYDYGTVVYTIGTADNFQVKFTDGSGQAVSEARAATGFIDQAEDKIWLGPSINAATGGTGGGEANAPLVLTLGTASPTAGDGVLHCTVMYRILETGL